MDMLQKIFVEPFVDMVAAPDFLMQVIWEGLVSGVLYALIALGFVLIFRSSRIFNFAQGIMVVFAALTLVGLHAMGIPASNRRAQRWGATSSASCCISSFWAASSRTC